MAYQSHQISLLWGLFFAKGMGSIATYKYDARIAVPVLLVYYDPFDGSSTLRLPSHDACLAHRRNIPWETRGWADGKGNSKRREYP